MPTNVIARDYLSFERHVKSRDGRGQVAVRRAGLGRVLRGVAAVQAVVEVIRHEICSAPVGTP